MRNHEARFLNRLRAAEGGLVTVDDLAKAVWGHRKDGGPTDINNNLRQYAYRLRQLGYPVHADKGYAAGYRFIPRFKEISDMADEQTEPKVIKRGVGLKTVADYMPPLEVVRLARTHDILITQRNRAMNAQAVLEGHLAASQARVKELEDEVAALKAPPGTEAPAPAEEAPAA